MKKNKATVILVCAIVIIFLVSLIAFLIFCEPKRILRSAIGIETTERIVLLKKDRDIDGLWVRYSYELEFGADEYEEVVGKLCDFYGGEYNIQSGIEYEHSDIKLFVNDSTGFPTGKHWFDPQEESVEWIHDSQCYKVLVSMDLEGRYHAYIQYDWSPFQSLIH